MEILDNTRSREQAPARDLGAELEHLDRDRALRLDLERELARTTAVLREMEERHQAAVAQAAEQLAERDIKYEVAVARAAASWEMVDEQLRAAALQVERARQSEAAAAVDVDRMRRRESELSAQLSEATAARETIERQLTRATAALEAAQTRAADEWRALNEEHAGRERELEARIGQEIENRREVEDRLAHVLHAHEDAAAQHRAALEDASTRLRTLETALEDTRRHLESRSADVERLSTRGATLESMLDEVRTRHVAVERRLAATEAAFQDADAQATRERLAASRKFAEREAELDGRIRQERAAREALEATVANVEAALRDAREQHHEELAAAARELAESQARTDRHLSDAEADRDRLIRRLDEAAGALAEARREHQLTAADVARLTRREAELVSQLADVEAARHRFEDEAAKAVAAAGEANERAARERAAAANREADLEVRLTQAIAAGEILERTLADTRRATTDAERLLHERADELRAQALEQAARYEVQLAQQRLEHECRLTDLAERLRVLTLERDSLHQSLAAAEERSHHLQADVQELHARLGQEQTEAHAEIGRLSAAVSAAERRYADVRSELEGTLDRLSARHADALAAMSAAVAERDRQLQERNAQLQEQRAQLHEQDGAIQELAAANVAIDALRAKAEQTELLRRELDESRSEGHRLFQQATLPMFRCSRDGALADANRACMTLVGRRTAGELSRTDFAATVFEDPNGLTWLIERCLSTRGKESLETTWRRKDGLRLLVRLSAHALSPDLVEITAEDLTRLRVLQERLDLAHRMEAVGRLSSEVAATCFKLLGDIDRNARACLAAAGNAAARQLGQHLIEDVTRAAELLRHLTDYARQQARAPAQVDLQVVIHDLGPVLKRVAGCDVEIQRRGPATPLDVDTTGEQIERLLVNLAAYARDRMPAGGRLTVTLDSIAVSSGFAARHPNVRPGPHALITVMGSRRSTRGARALPSRDGMRDDTTTGSTARKIGVDLGALQELVGECGGHLWMTVQPLGDIVAKIRLPLRISYDQNVSDVHVAASNRERGPSRWFQH